MSETNGEFTEQERARINEIFEMRRAYGSLTADEWRALGLTDEDFTLMRRFFSPIAEGMVRMREAFERVSRTMESTIKTIGETLSNARSVRAMR